MLSSRTARASLLGYLQQLRTNPNPGALHPRLAQIFPGLEDELETHLARLDTLPRPQTSAQR